MVLEDQLNNPRGLKSHSRGRAVPSDDVDSSVASKKCNILASDDLDFSLFVKNCNLWNDSDSFQPDGVTPTEFEEWMSAVISMGDTCDH